MIEILNYFSAVAGEDTRGYLILKDFILPLSTSFLGVWIAFHLFLKQIRHDKKKENNLREEEQEAKLMYFSSLVEFAIKNSNEEKNNLDLYIQRISENELDFIPLHHTTLNSITKIVKVINLEDYLLAYVGSKPNNTKEAVREFNDIVDSFSLLYEIFKHIKTMVFEKVNFDEIKKREFHVFVEKTSDKIIDVLQKLKETDIIEYAELLKIMQSMNTMNLDKSKYDIQTYYSTVILPAKRFCERFHVKNKSMTENHYMLGNASLEGTQVFENLLTETRKYRNNLILYSNEVEDLLIQIENSSQSLKRYID